MEQWLSRGMEGDARSVTAAKNTNDLHASTNTNTAKSITELGPAESVPNLFSTQIFIVLTRLNTKLIYNKCAYKPDFRYHHTDLAPDNP